MKEARKKFTLIELLVVIGLATLLMTIMLPAFNRMISGNAVDRAASELKLALEQAQSIAASSRKYTAILFPSGNTGWTTAEQKSRLGGYRICFINDYTDTTTNATFQRWAPDTEWKTPVNGARLLRVANSPPTWDSNGILRELPQNSGFVKKTISLLPSGEVSDDAKSLKTINSYEGSSIRANCAVIFSPYGQMKNAADAYLTIGETLVSGDNLIFPGGSNAGPVNFKTLHINRITGAVEYWKRP